MSVQGYAWQMDRPEMQHLIPAKLKDCKEVLFGNMDEIYNFHAKFVLTLIYSLTVFGCLYHSKPLSVQYPI